MDFKVAYWHPHFPKSAKIAIWIHTDMPHVVKKFVNALENSSEEDSKQNPRRNGKPASLQMCEETWQRSWILGALRTSKLNEDCFIKDAASRMRCYLAFRITSLGMVEINNHYCEEDEKAEYEPLHEVLLPLDKLIDIINA
jgi:hypothetical protein